MGIKRAELLTNNLKICENCEWCLYHDEYDVFAKCMLNDEEKGLFDTCDTFKPSTGKHFTIYY